MCALCCCESDWRVDLRSDSEEQHVSEDSDVETADDLSDDSDNSDPKYQLWHDSRHEIRAEIHHFSAPRAHVNCCAVPHISPDPSFLDCFWLTFTEELLNIFFARVKLLLPTTHSRTGRQTPQSDISIDGIYRFLALIILMGHKVQDTLQDYWWTNELHCTPFYSIGLCTSWKWFTLKIIKIHLTEWILIMTGCGKSEEFLTT